MTHNCDCCVKALRVAGVTPKGTKLILAKRGMNISISTIERILNTPDGAQRTKQTRATRQSVLLRRKATAKLIDKVNEKGPLYPSSKAICNELKKPENGGFWVSPQSVRRYAKACGFKNYKRGVRPCAPSPARQHFVKRQLEQRTTSFDLHIFSDEHFVSVNDYGKRTQYAKSRAKVIKRVRKSRYNVPRAQIWAAIGINWRSKIVFFPEKEKVAGKKRAGKNQKKVKQSWRLDGHRYIELCLQSIKRKLKKPGIIFMDDGATSHRNQHVDAWMKKHGVTRIADWPANSPDLNPIEELWAYLNDLIALQYPVTMEDLKRATIIAWEMIPTEVINNFVRSYKKKLLLASRE